LIITAMIVEMVVILQIWNYLSLISFLYSVGKGANVFGIQHSTKLLHTHISVYFIHTRPSSQCVSGLTVLTPGLCPRGQEHQSSCWQKFHMMGIHYASYPAKRHLYHPVSPANKIYDNHRLHQNYALDDPVALQSSNDIGSKPFTTCQLIIQLWVFQVPVSSLTLYMWHYK
jgi:hypothetical protein